jgi:toxin ParE1/3/4
VKVRFLTPASEEFLEALDFYKEQAAGLGAEFFEDLEHATELISANPQIGAPYEENTRRILMRRFPFNVIYEVHTDHVLIVAVAHQRRKPGYWKSR